MRTHQHQSEYWLLIRLHYHSYILTVTLPRLTFLKAVLIFKNNRVYIQIKVKTMSCDKLCITKWIKRWSSNIWKSVKRITVFSPIFKWMIYLFLVLGDNIFTYEVLSLLIPHTQQVEMMDNLWTQSKHKIRELTE